MTYEYEELKGGLYVCRSEIHSFGTDAFLLTGFSGYRQRDLVCDLGTGCGIIPLLMQRNQPPKQIFAVDIQPDAITQLKHALEKSEPKPSTFSPPSSMMESMCLKTSSSVALPCSVRKAV